MGVIETIIVGSTNELLGFVTLSLLLQISLASRFLSPFMSTYLRIGDIQDIYLLIGLEFLFTFCVVPSLVVLIQSSPAAKDARQASSPPIKQANNQLCQQVLNNFMMLLAAIFLATVTKVSFAVRLELAFVHLLCNIAYTVASLIQGDIILIYANSIARLSCLALVGYAVLPGFDGSFAAIVRKTAHLVVSRMHQLRLYLKI